MKTANTDQAERWNGEEGQRWVASQAQYDAMLAPFTNLILDAAGLAPGDSVLDVGCGCGATTLAAARAIAPGPVVGLDLSAPMLARARVGAERAGLANTSFVQGDAQVWGPPGRRFDAVISRFGFMFFADPVAAAANLRGITWPTGRLAFICWQPLAANDWLTVAAGALAEHVPLPDPGPPGAPGMFALADPDRIRQVLGDAGWQAISVTAERLPILVGGGGSVDDAVAYVRDGSLGQTVLRGAEPGLQDRALAALREALLPYADKEGVRLSAAVWVVQALTALFVKAHHCREAGCKVFRGYWR